MNITTISTHINLIRPGDTIRHNGVLRTVTQKNIRQVFPNERTVFGDSYMLGHKPVQKVIIHKAK